MIRTVRDSEGNRFHSAGNRRWIVYGRLGGRPIYRTDNLDRAIARWVKEGRYHHVVVDHVEGVISKAALMNRIDR